MPNLNSQCYLIWLWNKPLCLCTFLTYKAQMKLRVRSRVWFRNVDKAIIVHDDVIKWKHFPRYWPFVRGIHRSPVNSPHKGQWRGALMLSLICVWINGWINNREAGDLRCYRAHYDVIVMYMHHYMRVFVILFYRTTLYLCLTMIILSKCRNHASVVSSWTIFIYLCSENI